MIGTLMTGLLFIFFISAGMAAEADGKENVSQPADQKDKESSGGLEASKKKSSPPVSPPIYQPPLRGAPEGRVGGGSRGIGEGLIALFALAPSHVALTVREQPTLYWYLSKSVEYPAELTIRIEKDTHSLLETHVPLPLQPGIYPLRLNDFDIHLVTGTQYRWLLTLAPNPNRRSRDIVTGAIIERVEIPESLRSRLFKTNREEIPHVYAWEGMWYDALTAISNLIVDTPNNPVFRKHRAALLEQVGLSAAAQYDLEQELTGK